MPVMSELHEDMGRFPSFRPPIGRLGMRLAAALAAAAAVYLPLRSLRPGPGKNLEIAVVEAMDSPGSARCRGSSGRFVLDGLDSALRLPAGTEYLLLGDFNSDYREYRVIEPKHNDTGGVTGINHILGTIDSRGRLRDVIPLGLAPGGADYLSPDRLRPAASLVAEVRLLEGRTPYVLLGDWFPAACALVVLLGLGRGWRKRRRQGAGGKGAPESPGLQ